VLLIFEKLVCSYGVVLIPQRAEPSLQSSN
jgi:hypothetical protein